LGGWYKTNWDRATPLLVAIDSLEAAYGSRVVLIDEQVVAEWTRLLDVKDKNRRVDHDRTGSRLRTGHATVADVTGCDVEVLNPFGAASTVIRV
jgi:hypothetical protein